MASSIKTMIQLVILTSSTPIGPNICFGHDLYPCEKSAALQARHHEVTAAQRNSQPLLAQRLDQISQHLSDAWS